MRCPRIYPRRDGGTAAVPLLRTAPGTGGHRLRLQRLQMVGGGHLQPLPRRRRSFPAAWNAGRPPARPSCSSAGLRRFDGPATALLPRASSRSRRSSAGSAGAENHSRKIRVIRAGASVRICQKGVSSAPNSSAVTGAPAMRQKTASVSSKIPSHTGG